MVLDVCKDYQKREEMKLHLLQLIEDKKVQLSRCIQETDSQIQLTANAGGQYDAAEREFGILQSDQQDIDNQVHNYLEVDTVEYNCRLKQGFCFYFIFSLFALKCY